MPREKADRSVVRVMHGVKIDHCLCLVGGTNFF